MTAEDILRRLSEYEDGLGGESLARLSVDARAFLARPKPVMAEGDAWLWKSHPQTRAYDVRWTCGLAPLGDNVLERHHVKVRIPVPEHLLNPPEVIGTVVEDKP